MRFLVAGLFIITLLAGCLAGSGETSTAKDGLGAAMDAAEAFADGPGLVGVYAIEPFHHTEDEWDDGRSEYTIYLDDDPGDGKAPAWGFEFLAGDRLIDIIWSEGLGILAEGWSEYDDLGEHAGNLIDMDAWDLDSDEVADILDEHDEWPGTDEASFVFWELGQSEEGPVWEVAVSDGVIFADEVTAYVHAETGEVIAIEEDPFGESFGEAYAWADPTVTPLTAGIVSIGVGGNATIIATANAGTSIGDLSFTLEGPEGIVYSDAMALNLGTANSFGEIYEDLPEGTYTLTAETTVGVHFVHLEMEAYW